MTKSLTKKRIRNTSKVTCVKDDEIVCTLEQIRDAEPCKDCYRKFLQRRGRKNKITWGELMMYADDEEIRWIACRVEGLKPEIRVQLALLSDDWCRGFVAMKFSDIGLNDRLKLARLSSPYWKARIAAQLPGLTTNERIELFSKSTPLNVAEALWSAVVRD